MAKRKRRADREIFLDKLKKLSGNEQPLIGNVTLRNALRWEERRYNRIKLQLANENTVISGRGRGGSVGLADAPGARALNLFVSYSHADETLKLQLMKHLEPLRRSNLVEAWSDRKLTAGDEWKGAISNKLEKADIILLLVSIDFINSQYCYDLELDRALERHEEKSAVVIPVILRNCLWEHLPFAKLQALPKDGKAVAAALNIDEVLTSVVEGIRVVAEELRALR